MKQIKAWTGIYLIILSALFWSYQNKALAEEGGALTRSLPLVFDPATKKYFIGGSSKFSLKGEQSAMVERIEVSIDGGDYQPYAQSIQFNGEGKHTLKFRAIDQVNNWSPVQFIEVFVDLTPPTTEATFQDGKFFRGTEMVAAPAPTPAPAPAPAATPGDKGAPTVAAAPTPAPAPQNEGSSNMLFLARGSQISLVAQDNLSGIASTEFSWDNQNFNPYTHPITIQKTGSQTLYYRSIDKVGNTEPTKSLAFVSDGTAPTSTFKVQGHAKPSLIHGKNYLAANDSVAFAVEAADDASGVKQILVSVDHGPLTAYLRPLYFLQEGPHTMTFQSEDNVGNHEEPQSVAIYTVSNAPRTVATILGRVVNTGGINFATNEFQMKLDAQDNAVGLERIEFKTDADPEFKTYLEPIRFKTAGIHTVYYRALDRAGNLEPAKSYVVNIVDKGPETDLSTAQPLVQRNGITYSPAPNIVTLNVKNNGVGVQDTLVSMNDGGFHTYDGPITLNASSRVVKITYKSVDKLGVEESPKSVVYHMVGTMPVVDLFVSGSQNQEEQIRANYFDPSVSGGSNRGLASVPEANDGKTKKKKHHHHHTADQQQPQ